MKSIKQNLFNLLLIFCLLITFNSCGLECQQRCNYGQCDEYGNCECFPGWEGEYCEREISVSTYGYNCENGDCNYVSSNGTFSSITECELYCSSGGSGSNGGGQNVDRGSVRFYTPTNFNCGVLYVDLLGSNNDPKQLFYLSSNSSCQYQCAPLHCAQFNVDPGTYNYRITCNDDPSFIKTGTVYVSSGNCIEEVF